MSRRLAILPARGGSKRIPNKNIRDFDGAPMISHVLKTIDNSNLFDKIHVSTDSIEIANVVSKLGFEPDFMRPSYLADDYTPLMPVLKDVVQTFADAGKTYDTVALVTPCSPLVETVDLLGAMEIFDKHGGKHPCLCVTEYPVPIEWAFERQKAGHLTPKTPDAMTRRSQDMPKHYFDSGLFTIYSADQITASIGAGDYENYVGYTISKYKGIDIDCEDDWRLAEALFKSIRSGSIDGDQ